MSTTHMYVLKRIYTNPFDWVSSIFPTVLSRIYDKGLDPHNHLNIELVV